MNQRRKKERKKEKRMKKMEVVTGLKKSVVLCSIKNGVMDQPTNQPTNRPCNQPTETKQIKRKCASLNDHFTLGM